MLYYCIKTLIFIELLFSSICLLAANKTMELTDVTGFRIVELSSGVRFRNRDNVDWNIPDIGEVLPAGSLLSLNDNARIGFQPLDKNLSPVEIFGQQKEINVLGPVVFRLEKETFRRIVYEDFEVDFDISKEGEKVDDDDDDTSLKIADAWRRILPHLQNLEMAALLSEVQEMIEEEETKQEEKRKEQKERERVAKEKRAEEELELLNPIQQAKFREGGFPITIQVAWRHEGGGPYIVKVKSRNQEEEEEEEYETSDREFRFQLDKPGEYEVRVETEDGVLASETHQFSVNKFGKVPLEPAVPIREKLVKSKLDGGKDRTAILSDELDLYFPKNNSYFYVSAPERAQNKDDEIELEVEYSSEVYNTQFFWDPSALGTMETVELVIKPLELADGRPAAGDLGIFDVKGVNGYAVPLPAGKYEWYILCFKDDQYIRSYEKRTVSVKQIATPVIDFGIRQLGELLSNDQGGVLVLGKL